MERLLAAGLIFAVGCSASDDATVVISIASSLTEIAEVIEDDFEQQFPDIDLEFNIGGSQTIVAQIAEGAPADVVMTADEQALAPIANDLIEPESLATNQIVVLIGESAPANVETLTDVVNDPALIVVACESGVPCGRLTDRVLADAGVNVTIDSRELNVRLARSRVTSGEADVAFVYRTDASNLEGVRILDVPSELTNAVTVASIRSSSEIDTVRDYLRGPGTELLTQFGFAAL